jgi:glutamate racemase
MDKRPIGVFDSGLGGLTAVRQLMEQMPGEDIIYFGDTSRVPYGGRSPETILKYTRQDINFLLQFDIKAIVIACNTADTVAGARVQREYDLPICGAVRPAARKAAISTKNNKIGVIGTNATIGARAYDGIIREVNPGVQIKSVACPLLVPLVENFRFRPGDPVAEMVVEEYLTPLKEWGCDTLVLGCTHYPLLWDIISACMGPEVTLINSGREAACQLAQTLKRADMLAPKDQGGQCKYYVSDSAEGFSQMASAFLEKPVEELVGKIDIERY